VIKNPIKIEDTVATSPGTIKLRFRTYPPILVVPVWSKEMAASRIGRQKEISVRAGKSAIRTGELSPSAIPTGMNVMMVAAWLASRMDNAKSPTARSQECC
jgi:hypothetical protein